ncbi:SMI1/KNR4 family protein [Paenibacillus sp. MMS18-CY102]|uniref:SMI1/KNR4 family protein n=1 Tax=Paenibacillus sp. MMS18-CY102 TaxID=2682849 RepID=UPI00136557A6|nr:SMI1/KNR4 family protein [Paenibacillus sp. MMS18-CY102]MWC31271.1 SMI1/KNR4 family protein [Paenibacillus sp. MMS18-CY102]
MKNLDYEYSFNIIGFQDIKDFENKHSIQLPNEYKQFLMFKNGGRTEQRRFTTNDATKKGKITSSVSMFFPLSKENEVNIEEKFEGYNLTRIVPSNLFPIALDPVQGLICLSIEGEDEGSVYHCDMDYFDEDNELRKEYIRLISKSFTEFLDGLSIPAE